jgi:hypothetical protein
MDLRFHFDIRIGMGRHGGHGYGNRKNRIADWGGQQIHKKRRSPIVLLADVGGDSGERWCQKRGYKVKESANI